MSSLVARTKELLKKAQAVLELDGASNPETLSDVIQDYVRSFTEWEQQIANEPRSDADAAGLRDAVAKLAALHHKVIEKASVVRDAIGDEIKNLRTREHALRRYVDPFPQRITIAGKRKG